MAQKLKCEGCGYEGTRKHIIWFLGHWLCHTCTTRKNMPLVGYKNKIAWDTEQKLIYKIKDRFYPKLTWHEQKILWKEYMAKGLSVNEAKNRLGSLKARIAKSHWSHNPKPPVSPP